MRIHSIEATDMGPDQQEIADRVAEIIGDRDFKTPDEFWDLEGHLVTQACNDLGWTSVPSTGGLVVNWDSADAA